MAEWRIPRVNEAELATLPAPTSDGDIIYVTDRNQLLIGDLSDSEYVNLLGNTTTPDAAKVQTHQLALNAVQNTNITDGTINHDKLVDATEPSLLGSDQAAGGDIGLLDVSELKDMLDINPGDRLEIQTGDTINIKDSAVANTYVFPTVADRNAGTNEAASQDVRWNAGDIAITRNDGNITIDEVWIYTPNGTGAQTASNADFIEVTENIIDTNDLADFAVTNDKLATDSVETNKVLNDAITGPKLANSAFSPGTGLTYTGGDTHSFAHATPDSVASDHAPVTDTFVSGLTFDQFGHVGSVSTAAVSINTDEIVNDSVTGPKIADGAFVGGTGITYTGGDTHTFTLTTPAAVASNVTASANTYVSGLTFDAFGRVGSVSTAAIAAGTGVALAADGTLSNLWGEYTLSGNTYNLVANSATNMFGVDSQDFSISSGVLKIDIDAIGFGEIQNIGSNTIIGRNDTGDGNPEALTPTEVRAMINVEDGATNTAHPAIETDGSTPSLATGITAEEIRTLIDFNEAAHDAAAELADAGTGITVTYDDSGNALTIAHSDTSSIANVTESNLTYLSGATFDTFGHVQTLDTQSISAGNGVQISVGGEISVTATHAAETVVFTSIANRNAARAVGWNQGDVAIVNDASGTESFIYIGSNGNTAATTAADWAELTFASGDNTTYAFGSGTNGNFTVTPQIGGINQTAQTVTVGHPAISAASSVDGSGRTYVQDITLDSFGHITGIATATETVVDTNTTYSAGTGIGLSGTTFSVAGGTGITADTNGVSITSNGVGATQLNVSGNGSATQFLRSDGDGSFSWAVPTNTNTTYTAGTGLTLSGTVFSVTSNAIGADQLNVSGNGASTQFLRADGDGSFTWAVPTNTDTTYSAGNGISLSGTQFTVAAGTGLSQESGGLATNDSQIVHDNLSGFVANEHINHASVTLTAGTGLTGGGTIAASRTFNIDIASEAEAVAGTDNAHVMTPLRVRDVLDDLVVIEAETNGDPVASDFTNGALFVAQY